MTRSQELFELLARRAREREAARPDAPAAEKQGSKSAKSNTKRVSPTPPPRAPTPSDRDRAERSRERDDESREVAIPVESAPRIAAPDSIVLSRRGATMLFVLAALLVAVAFLAGERVGRQGGLIAPTIATLSSEAADAGAGAPAPPPRAPAAEPTPSGETYGIRVVTYEFNQQNAERASEVQEYLRSQGLRDVDARRGKNGTELRIYAGRYSRVDDPALRSMLETVKSLPGDAKAKKKDALPFATAYIMRRGD